MNDAKPKDLTPKRSRSVWQKHGLKLLAMGLALLVLTFALVTHNASQQALTAAKNSYQQQQSMNSDASQSSDLLKKYLGPYRNLQEHGLVDQPRRLQWLETLQARVNEILLPQLNFVLSPSVVASATNTSYASDLLAVKVTPMRIEFALMHEGDFFQLVRGIKARSKGLFSVENCQITRGEGSDMANKPGFKGYCELVWYSLADITLAWELPNAAQ